MNQMFGFITAALLITLLYINGKSRLESLIFAVALQGILVGISPLVVHINAPTLLALIVALVTVVIKGVVIPYFLIHALQGVGISRERKPSSGYISMIITTFLIVLSFWIGRRLQASELFPWPILVSVGGSMVLSGLFMIVTRGKALSQIIGYLVLENGIYLFGVSLGVEQTLTVELGVLLDVLVCVFITGILIHRINREFDSISTQQLDALRE